MQQSICLKEQIRSFWNSRPCDAERSHQPVGTREFFDEIRDWRYDYEHHIPHFADFSAANGKQLLEIGLGVGTDTVEFARHGAVVHGIDLTPRAVDLTRRNLEVHGFKGDLRVADAEAIPYPDNHFDIVYSYGVLLCIPNIRGAVAEIYRVLKPGGCARVMLYHRTSYNYWVNIRLLRRLGLHLLRLPAGPRLVSRLTGQPVEIMEEYKAIFGCNRRFSTEFFVNHNTDGPGNPYTSVYTKRQVTHLFRAFSRVEQRARFLNKNYIPFVGRWITHSAENVCASLLGWHLCIVAYK